MPSTPWLLWGPGTFLHMATRPLSVPAARRPVGKKKVHVELKRDKNSSKLTSLTTLSKIPACRPSVQELPSLVPGRVFLSRSSLLAVTQCVHVWMGDWGSGAACSLVSPMREEPACLCSGLLSQCHTALSTQRARKCCSGAFPILSVIFVCACVCTYAHPCTHIYLMFLTLTFS